MLSISKDEEISKPNTSKSLTLTLSLSRQISYKRANSESDDQDVFEEPFNKRGRSTTSKIIACPLADLGCLAEISADNLCEHYQSQIHQETLLKAVKRHVHELHHIAGQNLPISTEKKDYSEILDSISILAEGLSCLQNENIEHYSDYLQLSRNLQELQRTYAELNKATEESSQMLHVAQMNNNVLQAGVETLQQTLLESASMTANDGSYIWKITGVGEKIANAISDRQSSIYSPPFYSSPTGYKMCMRLYLNGDGNARRTHISLFFVLLRGGYDPILVWPFSHKISFVLYDQTGNQRHMIDSFRPDVRSNSFQRPLSNMNIASGIPKFLPLSIIQQENNPYIRDDCMFIRCMVDFGTIPKACIPAVANINPGLPLTVQETVIQAEIQKYKSTVDTSKKSDDPDMKS